MLGQGGAPIAVSAKGTVPATALGVFNVTERRQAGRQPLHRRRGRRGDRGRSVRASSRSSGVDPIHTMVDMIASLRAYESGQKAIQTIDETMQEAASSVGSIGGGG